jgi:hypothetical protein
VDGCLGNWLYRGELDLSGSESNSILGFGARAFNVRSFYQDPDDFLSPEDGLAPYFEIKSPEILSYADQTE